MIMDYGPVILASAAIAISIAAAVGVHVGRQTRAFEERLRADKAEAELTLIKAKRSAATAKGNRTKRIERQRLIKERMLDLQGGRGNDNDATTARTE